MLSFRRELFKNNQIMNKEMIKSKINVVEARIRQIQESDLFTDEQREKLIHVNNKELQDLETQLAKDIEVVNPEIL
jgi:hypothetical protein